jgi:hypothetical protein
MGVRDRQEDPEIRWSSPLRLLVVLLLASLAGCTPPETPKQPTVSLRMTGTPADATVVIDDEVVGTLDFVAAHGVALPPGVHHVTVTASGYFPRDQEVEARPRSPPIRVEVALQPVPD